ncbi:helix-turn-helix domain-containing protein [Aestuariibaculum sediminum]|uniref:Uncharacterized protein n=1 Tax=Aestuariibaculum sediminum TaxID=2770637 RepID=A0A8J6QGE2_9FLAO|nr:hypothetical protein [Aestuariibaculum sediminum]MBD0831504.1 hypothetical protein [Aestuariibaculum sediminum]
MIKDSDYLNFVTSIEIVLKDLRKEKGLSQGKEKGLSQSDVNIEFAQKYDITLNMGRMESHPNFTMTKLYLLCKYFEISLEDFFKRVSNKNQTEIDIFLNEKENRLIKKKHKKSN